MKHLCWSCTRCCGQPRSKGIIEVCKQYNKRNPFSANVEIDREDSEQEAFVVYGDFDIELRVTFEMVTEDIGIGHWECHGRGYHLQIVSDVDILQTVEFIRYDDSKPYYTEIKLNEEHEELLVEAINEAI